MRRPSQVCTLKLTGQADGDKQVESLEEKVFDLQVPEWLAVLEVLAVKQTKTLVSRKNLALIHLFPGEMAASLNVAQPFHQGVDLAAAPLLRCKLHQPFTKRRIESLALGAGNESRLLDQLFVGAKDYIFHTNPVYTRGVF
jgi:hypothetical protein